MKMKTKILAIILLATCQIFSQKGNLKNKKMDTIETSTKPVKAFFDAFSKGDFQGILNTFHKEVVITAVRESTQSGSEIYGTYNGIDGVKKFLSNLGTAFDTKAFSVQNIVGNDKVAFANGKFVHKIKQTEKLFASDWALYAVIKDGKIIEYHFYEDSEKFSKANTK
jgi:uncharacterized protein